MGYSQAVRHGILTPVFVGPIPTGPVEECESAEDACRNASRAGCKSQSIQYGAAKGGSNNVIRYRRQFKRVECSD